MSITSILQTGYTGLATSQAALRTISQNIANVNTPGYGRLRTQLESLSYSTGGAGVRIAEIQRVADRFLDRNALAATGAAERSALLAEFHSRVQNLLGAPGAEGGISEKLNAVSSAFGDLSVNPADSVRRRAALTAVQNFFDEAARLSANVQQLRTDASNQLAETITTANGLLARIHQLNKTVVQQTITRNDPSGAIEQRNQALNELAQYMDIATAEQPDGSVFVTTTTGLSLVDSATRRLSYLSPGEIGSDVNASAIQIYTVNPQTGAETLTPNVLDAEITGGRIRALIDLRDRDLADIQSNLGEITRVVADNLNAVHNAFSAVPAPAVLDGRQTGLAATDRAGFTGRTAFSVVDANGIVQAKTVVDFSSLGAGADINAVLAAINSGLGGAATASFSNGVLSLQSNTADSGVVVTDDPAAASNRGGQSFSQFFGLNDLVRGPRPSNFRTGITGTDGHLLQPGGTMQLEVRDSANRLLGTVSYASTGSSFDDILSALNSTSGIGNFVQFSLDANGQLQTQPQPGFQGAKLRVVSDSTNRAGTNVTLSDFLGLGQTVQAEQALSQSVRADIAANPAKMALAQFDFPASVGSFGLGVNDNRGANALRDIFSTTVDFNASGSLAAARTKLVNYMGALLGDAAVRAKQATQQAEDSEALRSNAVAKRDDYSGVNLDEELSNLLVYQNSYNASARVMSAARELYDTLLQIVN
jgi:flagellar hook-associated protein 1 FlgK